MTETYLITHMVPELVKVRTGLYRVQWKGEETLISTESEGQAKVIAERYNNPTIVVDDAVIASGFGAKVYRVKSDPLVDES